jgi:crotonobetainyl-CoA:carnitine CoA-transferase CaiB-like acyl-CoA transferase
VEVGQGISAPFCAKLLAALGAEVIKVEPVNGDVTRRLGPFPGDRPHVERSGLFLYLNTGKQSITLNLHTTTGRELLLRLASWADVAVENFSPQTLPSLGLAYDVFHQTNPRLILTSITPFGQSGPYRDQRAADIGIRAISGELSVQGQPCQPLKKGGEMASYLGGLNGFLGTMAALVQRERTGKGQHVDVSLAEGLTAILGGPIREQSNLGRPPRRKEGSGLLGPGGIYPTRDGFILAMARMGSDWRPDFAKLMGDPGLASDVSASPERQAEFEARFRTWLQTRTKHEVYHLAQQHRHPFGYVATAQDILASPQLAHRRFLEQVHHPEAGVITLMGLPFLIDGERWPLGRAPLLGEHTETVCRTLLGLGKQELAALRRNGVIAIGASGRTASPENRRDTPAAVPGRTLTKRRPESEPLPLAGIRVLDLSQVWSGPYCTRVLADLGAEVIKVEATFRPDPERGPGQGPFGNTSRYPRGEPGERPYNRAGRFNEYGRNKFGITLDLRDAECLAMARELIRLSDMVVENYSVGVMERLGLGYQELKRLRSDIILLSMPGWGCTGPEAHYVAYGPTQEAMSGLSSITGYSGGPPMLTGIFYGDPVGGTLGAVAALTALWHRRQTGQGMHIDLSQREAMLLLLPQVLLEYQFNGRILTPDGNHHSAMAPHGCYPCRGDDSWIALAVEDDIQWHTLCRVMSRPEAANDPRFSTLQKRLQHREALDELIATWTREHEHYALMHTLQAEGIAAQAVLNMAELLNDPHYRARGFFQAVQHPEAGTHPHTSQPWRSFDTPLPVRRPAPCLGEHNRLVLGELLGIPQETLQKLEKEGKIGTTIVTRTDGRS